MKISWPRLGRRAARAFLLLVWAELGVLLILLPWSDVWETNYFLYKYPAWGFILDNAFLRGAISGLGLVNVFLAFGGFRRATPEAARRAAEAPASTE